MYLLQVTDLFGGMIMGVAYAWHNTFQDKKRTISAVSGITFSVLLMFMQLGFLDTTKRGTTLLYQYMDFDLIITSDKYELMTSTLRIDRARLIQASIVAGVEAVMPLNIKNGQWEDPETQVISGVMIIGIGLNPSFIKEEDVRSKLDTLSQSKAVMLDTVSTREYGPLNVGRTSRINNVDVTVASLFKLGMVFHNEGAVLVSNQTFQSLVRGDSRKVTFGLVRVLPGADIAKIKQTLKKTLPSDVFLFDKKELLTHEQNYYINVVPVGIMFQAGVFIAFAIGAVILFQVLATEITNRLNEFATLKAMGYSTLKIYMIGFKQALIFAILGYIPAMIFCNIILYFLRTKANMPAKFTLELGGIVLAMTLAMCLISGFLALQKVRKADPADLF
jgi:putative ABC transport system permease protein